MRKALADAVRKYVDAFDNGVPTRLDRHTMDAWPAKDPKTGEDGRIVRRVSVGRDYNPSPSAWREGVAAKIWSRKRRRLEEQGPTAKRAADVFLGIMRESDPQPDDPDYGPKLERKACLDRFMRGFDGELETAMRLDAQERAKDAWADAPTPEETPEPDGHAPRQ